MFTGLVQATGKINKVSDLGNGKEMIIECPNEFCSDIKIGDSISIDGVCSTAISKSATTFTVQYLEETLNKTTMDQLAVGDIINLEPCLTPTTKLGGHIVSGHVDDTGIIKTLEYDGEWAVIKVSYKEKYRPFLISKGSIAINGISLTVVDVTDTWFSCHLIPHTIANTSLKNKMANHSVNLEFDQVGKYLYHFYTLRQ
jgi:riboflavin synthase